MSFLNDYFKCFRLQPVRADAGWDPAMNQSYINLNRLQLQQSWFSIEIVGGRHSGGQQWNVTALWKIYIKFKQVFLLHFSKLVHLLCWCFISETGVKWEDWLFIRGLLLVSLYTYYGLCNIFCSSFDLLQIFIRCYCTAFVLWAGEYTNLQV